MPLHGVESIGCGKLSARISDAENSHHHATPESATKRIVNFSDYEKNNCSKTKETSQAKKAPDCAGFAHGSADGEDEAV